MSDIWEGGLERIEMFEKLHHAFSANLAEDALIIQMHIIPYAD